MIPVMREIKKGSKQNKRDGVHVVLKLYIDANNAKIETAHKFIKRLERVFELNIYNSFI